MNSMRFQRSIRFLFRECVPPAAAAAVVITAGGCRTSLIDLQPVRVSIRQFDLGAPPALKTAREPLPYILAVEPFTVVAPLDRRFAIRTGRNEVKTLADCRWRERPELVVTAYTQEYLVRSGMFRAVAPVGSGPVPDLVLSGVLERFEWRRSGDEIAAVVEASVQVRRVSGGTKMPSDVLVYSKVLQATSAAKSADPADLADAMSRCTADLCRTLRRDLAARLASGSAPGGAPPPQK